MRCPTQKSKTKTRKLRTSIEVPRGRNKNVKSKCRPKPEKYKSYSINKSNLKTAMEEIWLDLEEQYRRKRQAKRLAKNNKNLEEVLRDLENGNISHKQAKH